MAGPPPNVTYNTAMPRRTRETPTGAHGDSQGSAMPRSGAGNPQTVHSKTHRNEPPMNIVEHSVVPRSPTAECADQLILGSYAAGVADGTTAKDWEDPSGPDGVVLAKALATALAELAPEAVIADAAMLATNLVASLLRNADIPVGTGAAVTFCVVHASRREVWRIGEARVLVNGTPWPPANTGEGVVAAARALVLRDKLAAGVPREQLMRSDPGRGAVQTLLRSLVNLRNVSEPSFGYGAIDGTAVPDQFLETLRLPDDACEIVVSTDGYPAAGSTLAEAESLLAARLRRDPLLIDDVPETKGLRPGAHSFDDRAYLRLTLPAASS